MYLIANRWIRSRRSDLLVTFVALSGGYWPMQTSKWHQIRPAAVGPYWTPISLNFVCIYRCILARLMHSSNTCKTLYITWRLGWNWFYNIKKSTDLIKVSHVFQSYFFSTRKFSNSILKYIIVIASQILKKPTNAGFL